MSGKARNSSTEQGAGTGGSHSYGLDGLAVRSTTNKYVGSTPDKTTWDSKEHIMVFAEEKRASDEEDASFDGSERQDKVTYPRANEASDAQKTPERHSASLMPNFSSNQILVTTEYTVAQTASKVDTGS